MLLLLRVLSFLLSLLIVHAQECDTAGRCDLHERCPIWKAEGECVRERAYMQKHCPVSCASGGSSKNNKENKVPCRDYTERCRVWADLGECQANPVNMKQYCPLACNLCTPNDEEEEDVCTDLHQMCPTWANQGECQQNQKYMNEHCRKSCGTCPNQQEQPSAADRELHDGGDTLEQSEQYGTRQTAEGEHRQKTLQRIVDSIRYMETEQVRSLSSNLRDTCKNRHELCSFWASIDECTNNPAYMATNCAVACFSCHMIDFETRCPKIHNQVPGLLPGDLNKMFQRIVDTAPGNKTLSQAEKQALSKSSMTEYTVHIHSQPDGNPDDQDISFVNDKSMPPWVVTFENFLTPQECQDLIQLGYKYKYKRSEDVGKRKFDGSHDAVQSEKRTSYNAWCSDMSGCRAEELPRAIHERIATVLDIPADNSEDFQMLRYEKGAFYRTHHDYIPHQKDRNCGPRILTFFLYLSDVTAGGGTNFPQLDITVMPKQGRALLWPSVLNSDPSAVDSRTYHQAMDVEEGIKYAANGWIHLYDYKTPQKNGCT